MTWKRKKLLSLMVQMDNYSDYLLLWSPRDKKLWYQMCIRDRNKYIGQQFAALRYEKNMLVVEETTSAGAVSYTHLDVYKRQFFILWRFLGRY